MIHNDRHDVSMDANRDFFALMVIQNFLKGSDSSFPATALDSPPAKANLKISRICWLALLIDFVVNIELIKRESRIVSRSKIGYVVRFPILCPANDAIVISRAQIRVW